MGESGGQDVQGGDTRRTSGRTDVRVLSDGEGSKRVADELVDAPITDEDMLKLLATDGRCSCTKVASWR